MKSSTLIQAGALCGALAVAASASASTINTETARLYISGATATDAGLTTLFVRNASASVDAFCSTAGTLATPVIDVYVDAADIKNAKQRVVVCPLKNAVGSVGAGTVVAVFKESNGGSADGTTVIADAGTRLFMNETAPACTASNIYAANSIPNNGGVVNSQIVNLHTGCTGTATVRADAGVADVNPALFTKGTAAITQAQIDRLTADPLYQPMFGVAVSLNFYRALQRAQGKSLDDLEANVPSLPQSTIAGLFTQGGTASWGTIQYSSGGVLKSIADVAFTETSNKVVNDTVFVCRRGDESGTQASFAQFFLDERCGKGDELFKTAIAFSACQQNGCTWSSTTYGADATFAGKGSGDVRNCLDGHNDFGAATVASPDHYAIGILGSESKYDSSNGLGGSTHAADGTQAFRYVAIDGRVPNLENVAKGKYDFVMDDVLNRRNVIFNGIPVISGSPAALADYIASTFGAVDVISTLIVPQAHGSTGGLADVLNNAGAATALPINLTTNPVSVFTKVLNGPVNDCSPAVPLATVAP
jgi:hypothetical protein